MDKIFIQIASYRDPELLPTIIDCIEKAAYPDRLRFGICWQRDALESIAPFDKDPRFRIHSVLYQESKGTCWARNLIQSLYDGEKYTLHLDSHHRFLKDWDEILIDMYESLKKRVEKPLITGYPPAYYPETGHFDEPLQTYLGYRWFRPSGVLLTRPVIIREDQTYSEPFPARFLAAGFCFVSGAFCNEVPHDPNLYYLGEEPTLAARAFTWGYDLFHPNKWVIWHEYFRNGKPKHWDDRSDNLQSEEIWTLRDLKSLERYRILLGMQKGNINFGKYGFGNIRSFLDYEKYAGIKYSIRGIDPSVLAGLLAPTPYPYKNEQDWIHNLIKPKLVEIRAPRKPEVNLQDDGFVQVQIRNSSGTVLMNKQYDFPRFYRFRKKQHYYFRFEITDLTKPQSWALNFQDRFERTYQSIEGTILQ